MSYLKYHFLTQDHEDVHFFFSLRTLQFYLLLLDPWCTWIIFVCKICEIKIQLQFFLMCLFIVPVLFFFKLVYFLATPQGLWDLSSPTRDWTWATAVKAKHSNHSAIREHLSQYHLLKGLFFPCWIVLAPIEVNFYFGTLNSIAFIYSWSSISAAFTSMDSTNCR